MMICAVCRRVLNMRGTSTTGFTFMHTMQDAAVDHEPQPIPAPDGYREGRCDFCNTDHPVSVLPVRDFAFPGGIDMSRGDWAACPACGELIDANRWVGLIERVAELRSMGPVERSAVARLYRVVRKNIAGSLRPIVVE